MKVNTNKILIMPLLVAFLSWNAQAFNPFNYFPSVAEVAINVAVQTGFNLGAKDWAEALGKGDPTATVVVRDATKILSNAAHWGAGTKLQQGKRSYIYASDRFLSSLTKVGVKLVAIKTLPMLFNVTTEEAAKLANFPGDVLSQVVVSAGEHWQDSMKSGASPAGTWFLVALAKEPKDKLLVVALVSVIPKTWAMDRLGTLWGKHGYAVSERFQNAIFEYTVPFVNKRDAYKLVPYNRSLSIWENAAQGEKEQYWQRLQLAAFAQGIPEALDSVITTYALAPPARVILDVCKTVVTPFIYAHPFMSAAIIGVGYGVWHNELYRYLDPTKILGWNFISNKTDVITFENRTPTQGEL